MTEVKSDKLGQRPPFPLHHAEERPPLPRRPRIVWAYLIVSVASVGYGVAWALVHDQMSVSTTIWSVVYTALTVLLIWNASRAAWIFLTAWAVLTIPIILRNEGTTLYLSVAIHTASLGILLSPWMIRWIWRDGRRNEDRSER